MVFDYALQILEMFISEGHDFKKRFGMERLHHDTTRVDAIECVAGKGIRGDRYFEYKEDFKGQISFFSIEVAEKVAAKLGVKEVDRIRFRRNVITRGIDLNELIGKRFRIGDAEFFGTEECRPCMWMDEAVGPGACDMLKGWGGLRCRVVASGSLRVGSTTVEVFG